jgi:hypothetical protein
LDVALELGIPCGGWSPKGRKAEDGTIPACYPLKETPSDDCSQRTAWNIRDSDGTLILAWGEPTGGTLLTVVVCRSTDKPCLVIDLADEGNLAASVQRAREWIADTVAGAVLNVAGPRASETPAAYERARMFLRAVLGGSEG